MTAAWTVTEPHATTSTAAIGGILRNRVGSLSKRSLRCPLPNKIVSMTGGLVNFSQHNKIGMAIVHVRSSGASR
jgi:hypothetical protein